MKQKLYLASGLVAIAAIVAVGIVIYSRTEAQTVETNTSSSKPKPKSPFSFDATSAGGWTKGPSNESSMAAFSPDRSCFLSVERKSGAVDAAVAVQAITSNLAQGGYTVVGAGESVASIQTASGAQQLTLHQLSVTGTGAGGELYGGQSYGYVPLEKGHLSVLVNCNTVDQLASATPALTAIKFDD